MYFLYLIFKIKHYYFITKYWIIFKLLSTHYIFIISELNYFIYILFLYKVFGVAF